MSEPVTTRRRAPRGRGAELREQVLQAAMELLAETGNEDAVSVRAVAQRVGVSAPSIYLHFADKQALIDAVCAQVFDALHSRLRKAAEAATDPVAALQAQGVAYVQFALENPEQYRVVLMQPHASPQSSMESVGAGFDHLVESVRACLAAGAFEGDPLELALGLWTSVHGLAALLIAKPYLPWPELEPLIARTVWRAGVGLAAAARLDPPLPVTELVQRLDRLRS